MSKLDKKITFINPFQKRIRMLLKCSNSNLIVYEFEKCNKILPFLVTVSDGI